MEVIASRAGDDLNLASRKAQESDFRRFQATEWLELVVGPLGIPKQPSEQQFISCLRNGLVLCHAINQIEPGSVPKVVEISRFPAQSLTWDSLPLPAYQFFENVRNFLKAVEGLRLPVFEASVFERDNMVAGSSAKIVDCVLGLKEYNDRKLKKKVNESFKNDFRSPLVMQSNGWNPKQPPNDAKKIEDLIVKALAEGMIDAKENLDGNLLSSIRNGNPDSVKLLSKMITSTLKEQLQNKSPVLNPISKDLSTEESGSVTSSATSLSSNSSLTENAKHCKASECNHLQVVQVQEKKLLDLKELLSCTKAEFGDLQSQFQNDLKQMESQIEELSTAAQGYHKVVQENRNLYNMVQDLKGNIRVYCRIRPAFKSNTKNVIDFIGEDGSLVVMDPSKPNKDGKKLFQFNRVFGPAATQEEVFADTQPLIRSVMDGYNVCIFAYGQTGSGKTHTMCGPTGASRKELGINYLALNDLFDLSNKRKDVLKYEIFVQMVEIYNEQVRDLLTCDPTSTNKLEIRSCTSDNEEVFADTQPLIRSVMDGYNVCIFAYGQTGSGKTHTMCGPTGASRKELGINYLALNDLFDLSNKRKDVLKYEIFVQMVEIYNEQVRDLLTCDPTSTNKLEIRSCTSDNGLSLPDATIRSVKSTTDVQNLMKTGQVNRAVSSTAMNNQSSRSHSMLMVHVNGKDVNRGTTRSCLHLVDLAGSERVDKSEVTGEGLKEAQHINKSLSCLGDVITALSQKNTHIPYRNSKLTLLLQNSLGGNAKTLMFAHVSPEGDSFGETVSTLKFAQRASTVELGAARLNKESREVMDLKEQIENLKRQLDLKEPQSAQHVNRLEPKSPLTRAKPAAATVDRTPKSPRSPLTRPKPAPAMGDRTPPNSATKSRQVKPLVLPKTPEAQVSIRNEIIISSEIRGSTANVKPSHIRKSLRTIGKLINGSEKRVPVKTNEVQSSTLMITPPVTARPSRRQSLTGVQPLDRSRRSSLGGVDPCVDGNRTVRTPPLVSSSIKTKWM